jgi:molybdopterin synthase sulfur carrier subunit
MSVVVRIPAPLRAKADGQRQLRVEAHGLDALLDAMDAAYPGITERLRREDGTLRRTLNIYVNGENIRFLQGLDTPLRDGDEVSIVPAIAGG